jgi:hypothetical protein
VAAITLSAPQRLVCSRLGQGSTATIVLRAGLDQRTAELEAAEQTLGGAAATDRCGRLD